MGRSIDALKVIKAEIDSDAIYSNKTPAAVAILMMREVSRKPAEYQTICADKLEVMRANLTEAKIDEIASQLVLTGDLAAEDIADKQVEIKDRQCDLLHLGDIKQGDVESALALP